MADWDTLRDKAGAGLASLKHEGTRQASMAKAKLQLSDIRAERGGLLRDLGQVVLTTKESNTSLDTAQSNWEPLWSKLAALAERERDVQGTLDQHQAGTMPPSAQPLEALGSFCTQCGASMPAGARFCSGCGTALPK